MTHAQLCLMTLLAFSLLAKVVVGGEDVIDCGGFVRPSKALAATMAEMGQKLDYSKDIRVHLLSMEGKKKFSGECSPNGYYIIPVYEKGTFLVRIEGPAGWVFKPPQVTVTVGGNAPCSQDFELTGFSLSGRVSGEGDCASKQSKYPKGITLKLYSEDKAREPQMVISQADGSYTFQNVFPAKYTLEASHSLWTINNNKVTIDKKFGNIKVDKEFVVSGYDISGQVFETSDKGEPVKGVSFLLYSASGKQIPNCPKTATTLPTDRKTPPLCSVQSNAEGRFMLSNIPCGKYTLVPFYKSTSTTYDVIPKEAEIVVDQDSLFISEPFLVKGFSVHGRVVGSSGDGIDGVTVKAISASAPVRQTVTDPNGDYILDQITSGTYTLQAVKPHYIFSPINDYKISPNVAELPELVARRYHVCGKISIPQPPPGVSVENRKVTLRNNEKPKEPELTTRTDSTGAFCFEALFGQYTIIPEVPQSEVDAGLLLTDGEIEVSVESGPVLDINFEQARLTVSGRIWCIESPCDTSISVSLSAIGRLSRETTGLAIGHDNSGEEYFTFKGVLPGKYEVTINHENWCWEKESEVIEVTPKYQSDIKFVQTGYVFVAKTTNDVDLYYKEDGGEEKSSNVFKLKQGSNSFCLKKPGVYHFTPRSCFRFEQDTYKYDVSDPHVLKLTVKHYRVTGTIDLPSGPSGDPQIELSVTSEGGSEKGEILIPTTKKNAQTYEFSYWAEQGEKLTFKPKSTSLFFYPQTVSITADKTECLPPLPPIAGRPGMYLKGTVGPSFAGVTIKVFFLDTNELALKPIYTNSKGEYEAGPLYDNRKYYVVAEKEGYLLKEIEGKPGFFSGQKLGNVEVVVTHEGAPLSGVLLSLSGAEGYKNNNATDASGKFSFRNLFPGEYYLRSLLKEYVFSPSSKSVTIQEGEDLTVQLTATRTSYSAFGKVTSLNGEPEKGVPIEAVGPDGLFEETQSDATGAFRLRGLIPSNLYKIRVKTTRGKLAISRSQPTHVEASVDGKNIENLNFIVFRSPEKYDVTGTVTTSDEWLATLTVQLTTTDGNQQQTLAEVQLGPNNYFSFDGLDGEKDYIIKLKTSLSERQYSFTGSEQKVGQLAKTDKQIPALNLTFKATPAKGINAVAEPGSFATLLLAILIGAAFYFNKQIMDLFTKPRHRDKPRDGQKK